MKKIFNISMIALLALCFGACQKLTTEGMTRITYYANIVVEGETTVVHQKGTPYTDAGCTATLNGEDVTSEVAISNNVNVNKSGVYSVSYAYTNVDGFTASATRKVIVLDLNDAVEGFYMTSAASYRVNSAGTKTVYGAAYEILVTSNGDGTYDCDDMLGGYYAQRAGYGSNYAMSATFSIGADGSLTLIDSAVPGWGDAADGLEGSYDAATSTFTFTTGYAGMDFNVIMTKE